MKIVVDADACPVRKEILETAEKRKIPVVQVADTSHEIQGGTVILVDTGSDSADIRLMNLTEPGDLVVTQDYGVAALALGKRAFAMDPGGMRYTQENMDRLLFERALGQKIRRAGGKTGTVRKRARDANQKFQKALELYLREIEEFRKE